MKGEQQRVKSAVDKLGKEIKEQKKQEIEAVGEQIVTQNALPKDLMGISEAMMEGIYGQAYRLYNTGKYRDACQLFRLLIMLNSTEGKYAMGLAACFHMLKEYENAVETYAICGILDPNNPIPHYHASDCYLQLKNYVSALISLEMAVKKCGERGELVMLKDRAQLTIESVKKQIAEQQHDQEQSPG